MSILIPTLICFVLYFLGYRVYGRFIGQHLFGLDAKRPTPAHTLQDGVDYVPTRKSVLFGHHFASIAGLGPMLGPAVAVLWGWLPAMVWVVLGSIFIGCVHDFAALVVSVRARGMSIGKVAEGIIGHRAKTLFHVVIFFGVALAMGVFVFILGKLFSVHLDEHTPGYPQAVTPSAGLMVVAVVMGYLLYRKGMRLAPLATVAFLVSLALVYLGYLYPTMGLPEAMWPELNTWIYILLAYAFIASVLPVWILLQARDFVNSMLLYLGMVACYAGLLWAPPVFQAPAVRWEVPGAPPLWPFVFIIVACGAASGFHGLVSSGTTAKQLNKETDAPFIGYGGMIAESLLGLLGVLATTAGFISSEAWHNHYSDWEAIQGLSVGVSGFIEGSSRFMSALGVPMAFASAFIAVIVVSFALTTLDSATRLLRYNIEEIGETLQLRWVCNRYVSSTMAVVAIAFFAFYKVNGKPAGLVLWTLFGTINQLLAGLTLLTVTLYLKQRGKPIIYTGLPALFVLGTTMVAMSTNLWGFFRDGHTALWIVGAALWMLAGWIMLECAMAFRHGRRVVGWDVHVSA